MAQFMVDLRGRVGNTHLPDYKSLWPLFEAIVNSIQSLEDSDDTTDKTIEVYAQRQEEYQITTVGKPDSKKVDVTPFETFAITDNGAGFGSANYESFRTADSSLKWKKGCKGIGRFLWLKAFEKVEISSTFFEDDKWQERRFAFDVNGIAPDENVFETKETTPKTAILVIPLAPQGKVAVYGTPRAVK